MSVVTGAGFKTEIPPAVKIEKAEDIVRVDQNQIVVTLEKGEGTLQIEKIATVKKEPASEDSASNATSADTSVTPVAVGMSDAAAVVKSEPLETSGSNDTSIEKPTDVVKTEEQQTSGDEAGKPDEDAKSEVDSEKRTEKLDEDDKESVSDIKRWL